MSDATPARIVQIIPAADWWADFYTLKPRKREWSNKVAAWALMEAADGSRWVDGLTTANGGFDLNLTGDNPDFLAFSYRPADMNGDPA